MKMTLIISSLLKLYDFQNIILELKNYIQI